MIIYLYSDIKYRKTGIDVFGESPSLSVRHEIMAVSECLTLIGSLVFVNKQACFCVYEFFVKKFLFKSDNN